VGAEAEEHPRISRAGLRCGREGGDPEVAGDVEDPIPMVPMADRTHRACVQTKTSLALTRICDIMRLTGMTLTAELPESSTDA